MNTTPYGELLARYEGTGQISTAGDHFSCEFECSQMQDGSCILLASQLKSAARPGTLQSPFPEVLRFEGTLHDGRRIQSDTPIHQINVIGLDEEWDRFEVVAFRLRSFIVNAEPTPIATIRYGLTNFFVSEVERRTGGQSHAFSLRLAARDRETFAEVVPVENHRQLRVRVITTRSIAVTAELECRLDSVVDAEALQEYDAAMSDVCFVLSVARGTKVQWVYRTTEGPDGSERTREHRHHITRTYTPHSPIPHRWTWERQAGFIERGYTSFAGRRERYRLAAVIDAYIEAKTEGDFIETRALKLAVALEALKHSFALSRGWKAELFIEPKRFKKLTPKLRKAVKQVLAEADIATETISTLASSGNESGLNRRTFGQVVSHLAEELDLVISSGEMTAFSRSRNTLVHQGRFYASVADGKRLSRMPYGSPREEFFFDMFFLDRIILRLLGYEGEFYDARSFQEERVLRMEDFLRHQEQEGEDQ